MISTEYVRAMAAYNHWQNTSLYAAADGIDDVERRRDRGAFFGSVHATLNHILWGDQIWMSRLAELPEPRAEGIAASTSQYEAWSDLVGARRSFDDTISEWAAALTPADLAGDLVWHSRSMNRELTHPRWLLVTHMFNHQTHHRGQVHCMLTALGAKPDDTDIPFRRG